MLYNPRNETHVEVMHFIISRILHKYPPTTTTTTTPHFPVLQPGHELVCFLGIYYESTQKKPHQILSPLTNSLFRQSQVLFGQ